MVEVDRDFLFSIVYIRGVSVAEGVHIIQVAYETPIGPMRKRGPGCS